MPLVSGVLPGVVVVPRPTRRRACWLTSPSESGLRRVFSSLAQVARVKGDVLIDEACDEEVRVVVALAHAHHGRGRGGVAARRSGERGGERGGLELTRLAVRLARREEVVRVALRTDRPPPPPTVVLKTQSCRWETVWWREEQAETETTPRTSLVQGPSCSTARCGARLGARTDAVGAFSRSRGQGGSDDRTPERAGARARARAPARQHLVDEDGQRREGRVARVREQ